MLAASCIAAAGCGSSTVSRPPPASTAVTTTGTSEGPAGPAFRGARLKPEVQAPRFGLREISGKPVEIADNRGHATFVIFVYVHCPDVCPLIVQQLRRAQDLLPAAERPRIIAVSVDPKGDTPGAVRTFEKNLRMTGRMEYLIGTRPQLEATWARWKIGARVPKSDPEFVEHSSPIFGISGSGRQTTVYDPTKVTAKDLAHDAPLLKAR